MNTYQKDNPAMTGCDIDQIESRDHRLWHRLGRVQVLSGRYVQAERGSRFSHGRDGSRGQGRVLKALALVPEISQKDLMLLLDMRQQSLAELLGKLEAKGLIRREQATDDRRKQMVQLTDEGRAAAEEVERTEDEGPSFAFFDCLDDSEKEALEDYLTRIGDALEGALREQGPAREGRRGHRRGHAGENGESLGDDPREGRRALRKHDRDHEGSRGFGDGRRGRRGGGGDAGGPHFKRAHQSTPAVEENAASPEMPAMCDHNCRACPLRAQGTCVKRR